jgi:hypothetical protein
MQALLPIMIAESGGGGKPFDSGFGERLRSIFFVKRFGENLNSLVQDADKTLDFCRKFLCG